MGNSRLHLTQWFNDLKNLKKSTIRWFINGAPFMESSINVIALISFFIQNRAENWRLDIDGCLPKDMETRGVSFFGSILKIPY